jgi:hypothetical protein
LGTHFTGHPDPRNREQRRSKLVQTFDNAHVEKDILVAKTVGLY